MLNKFEKSVFIFGIIGCILLLCAPSIASNQYLATDVYTHIGTVNLLNGTITNYPLTNSCFITYNTTTGDKIDLVGFIGYNFTFYKNNVWVYDTTVIGNTLEFYPSENITNWRIFINYTGLTCYLYEASAIDDIDFNTLFTTESIFDFWSDYWSVFTYGILMLFPLSLWLAKSSVGSIAIAYLMIASLGFAMPEQIRIIAILPLAVSGGLVFYMVFWGNRQAQTK